MLPLLRARAAEPGPETTTIKLPKSPGICTMPQMITRQLLQAEGLPKSAMSMCRPDTTEPLPRGEVDFMVNYASELRPRPG